jgi:hypothetical protein
MDRLQPFPTPFWLPAPIPLPPHPAPIPLPPYQQHYSYDAMWKKERRDQARSGYYGIPMGPPSRLGDPQLSFPNDFPVSNKIRAWEDVWKKVSDVEFLQKKLNGYPNMMFRNDVVNLDTSLYAPIEYDVPTVLGGRMNMLPRLRSNVSVAYDIDKVAYKLQNKYSLVWELIQICDGRLFLCGGAVLSLMEDSSPNDFDMFFSCDSTEEADKYLALCLNHIDSKISDSTSCANIHVITVNIIGLKIQFIKRLYPSPISILDGFDLPGCKYGFGIDGLFTTISGAVAYITMSFPIDTKQITTSHTDRIAKYHYSKGFSILLPGHLGGNFMNTSGIQFVQENDNMYTMNQLGDGGDRSDYEVKDTHIDFVGSYPHLLKFHSDTAIGAMTLDDDVMKLTMSVRSGYDKKSPIFSKKRSKRFFGHMYREYAIAYVTDDPELDAIYQRRSKEVITILSDVADNLFHKRRWKTKDPGDQFFGKIHPLVITPKEWYGGGDYKAVFVGIDPSAQAAFKRCVITLSPEFPQDMINLIMREWARAELQHTTESLYS